ncbi:MAG: adenylate/guanylate cyclase domain-containing protein [Actinomycetota bacterium]
MDARAGLDLPQRVFTWFYRRLGRWYPAAFISFELQSSWLITLGTLGLFAFYYDAPKDDFLLMLAIALALTGATIAIALYRCIGYLKPVSAWIASDRQDPALATKAWGTAIGMPLELIRRDMKLPIFGVAVPGSLIAPFVLDLSPWAFFPILGGSLVSVGYSGILHYFAVEGGMRPIVVDINRVLPPRLSTGQKAIPLRFKLMAALPMINVITGLTAAALSEGSGGGGAALGIDVLIATAVALAISLELSVLLARSILRPINDLGHGIDAVRRGDFDHAAPVTTADELGELSAAFNQMVAGLAERERIREAFGTYLDKEVAEYILSEQFAPEGFEVEVSLLFCDVRDFTGFASDADAKEVVAALNRLFETVVPVIGRHGGHVDKFVGDGLLAVFGAPEPFRDHADRAVGAGVEIVQCVNHGEGELLEVGVGINSGPVVAGSIGGGGRLNFSVIGDAVNVAARVESATRQLDEEVLITVTTRDELSETIEVKPCGPQLLRGKEEPVELFAPVVQTVEQSLPAESVPAAE